MSDDELSGEFTDYSDEENLDEGDDTSGEDIDEEDPEVEVEGEDIDEEDADDEGDKNLKTKAPIKNIKSTLLTTTAVMPSLSTLGLSISGVKPMVIPAVPITPSPAQVPAFSVPTQAPTYSVPTQAQYSTIQGMQAVLGGGSGIYAPIYTGVQQVPTSGSGVPNIVPKSVSPKKKSSKTINYTAVDLTALRNEDLKNIAKERGLKSYSTLKKDGLVALLLANPLQSPITIKVNKSNIEEDVTIIPVESGITPIQSTYQTQQQPLSSYPIQGSSLSLGSNLTSGGLSLGGTVFPNFQMGAIGPIQSGPAVASLNAGMVGTIQQPIPIMLKDLIVKQNGESKDMHEMRTQLTNKASVVTSDPQTAANIGAVATNNAFLGVNYNNNTNELLSSLKL